MNGWREYLRIPPESNLQILRIQSMGSFPHGTSPGTLNYFRGGQECTVNRLPASFFDSCVNAQSLLGSGNGDLNKPRK